MSGNFHIDGYPNRMTSNGYMFRVAKPEVEGEVSEAVAWFPEIADAAAYCEWRNSPPTEPKFKVGDRVIRWGKDRGTISSVGVFVRFDDPGVDDCYVISHPSVIELAPPEPPAPKWTTKCVYNAHRHEHEWMIWRGDEELGTLRNEHLALDLCARQNAQEPAQ